MTIEIEIDAAQDLLRCRYADVLTDAELLDAWRAAYEHPDYRPGMPELVDFTALLRADVTTAAIQSLAEHSAAVFARHGVERVRVALLAPTPLAHGLARMYLAFMQGSAEDRMIFETREAALAHLDASG